MTPFRRGQEPAFWQAKEHAWLASNFSGDPLRWQHLTRTLSSWFHELARAPDEPPERCAYCDGPLGEQGRQTVDHFLPQSVFPTYALQWINLFPDCDECNSTYKRNRWACWLIRPDFDPVEQLFEFDPVTGRVEPHAKASRRDRARVRATIDVLGLNRASLCTGRRKLVRDLRNAVYAEDYALVTDTARFGPYRFVGERFLQSLQESP
jgi:uncharacterized protein (TIGR02646 family)